jgi:hypothetical protein
MQVRIGGMSKCEREFLRVRSWFEVWGSTVKEEKVSEDADVGWMSFDLRRK